MKKQEIEQIKQEHPEGLVMQTGACIYCGQIRQIETLNYWETEDCNELATELCDCQEAKLYTAKRGQKGSLRNNLGRKARSLPRRR